MSIITGYKNSSGGDIGERLVEKSYLIDRYPDLADTFRFAGLWGFGDGAIGQLGDNTIIAKSSPIQTIAGGTNWKQVSTTGTTTAAIKTDGTLWTWGSAGNGVTASGNNISRSSPAQTIAGGTDWRQVSLNSVNGGAIKADGTLWTWGQGYWGQLGDNTAIDKSSPVQTIAGGANWKQVSCGGTYIAAIKVDGTLWAWGNNTNGQLGDNTIVQKSSPVQTITTDVNWKQVACGTSHIAAIKTDGALWLWGQNAYGQLGDNTLVRKSSPVQTIAGGTNWKQVSCGDSHTAAIKTDGTLWTWGYNNYYGQLGDNTVAHKSSPIQTISAGTNWKQVACGNSHTLAIKTDGALWAWGNNTYGQLGDNTRVHKSSPVQTIAGGTNWTQVACGDRCTFAIRDNSNDYL